MTPEGKVKAQVKQRLKAHGAYYQMPVTGGYGKGGCSDFLVCYRGYFVSIECKADATKPLSALQQREASAVGAASGYFLRIHKDNLQELDSLLDLLFIRSVNGR